MPCTIYCLVPQPQQLEPLVDQLKDAGIETADIAIVPRRHWRLPSAERPAEPSPPASQAPLPLNDNIWMLPFVSAALWWQSVTGKNDMKSAPCVANCMPALAIPLAIYEAALTRGRAVRIETTEPAWNSE